MEATDEVEDTRRGACHDLRRGKVDQYCGALRHKGPIDKDKAVAWLSGEDVPEPDVRLEHAMDLAFRRTNRLLMCTSSSISLSVASLSFFAYLSVVLLSSTSMSRSHDAGCWAGGRRWKHVVRYTMHDLVHDLARSVISDELVVYDAATRKSIANEPKYCRYVLVTNYDSSETFLNILAKKVRAIHFQHSSELDFPRSTFSFAKCLRILDFNECTSVLLPASIGQLKQLRYLSAPKVQNERLPECITELSKLQYLNLNGSSQISALPGSIGKLGLLTYLCLSDCSAISKLPESFGELKKLLHLDLSSSGITELPGNVGNLTNLNHLELSECFDLKALPESLCGLTVRIIDGNFCDGKGAFIRLSVLSMERMEGLEEWNTTYYTEDGVEVYMFPVLDHLQIVDCPRLRLRPCPPAFRECLIEKSDRVITSLEDTQNNSNLASSTKGTRLDWRPVLSQKHHYQRMQESEVSSFVYTETQQTPEATCRLRTKAMV
ncbi:hypothetical protein PR202_ga21022 [Eleusine coracana subsp. coracana]|uniref:Disease resistance R13L4/SHOC-2-like LRR domain-containing protein n=1 Tax=Eleusine coracana subsp. coracana TaxID=191504 RepID=A0AAV5CZH1_ELECO|nr:hypothetical protein PR202_ga21022 [Eleusine coracana subsp. coracana]